MKKAVKMIKVPPISVDTNLSIIVNVLQSSLSSSFACPPYWM